MGIKKILHVSLIKNKLDDHKNIGQAKICLLLAQPPSLNKVSDFILLVCFMTRILDTLKLCMDLWFFHSYQIKQPWQLKKLPAKHRLPNSTKYCVCTESPE